MASDGAPMPSSSISSTRRDSDIATKLQNTTILTIQGLQEITDGFSEKRKIGQGAYGKVYLAKLKNGEEIAVKVLYNNTPGIDDEQFQREFGNLMRLEHQNIVRLVGYCYETQHQPMQYKGRTIFTERTYRALCFEYMQNGSLEKHLSDECDGLDWITRYKIIKGAWMGLKYLHEGFREPIYHLDLKPDNILLDKNMLPKLADFGLSKLFGDKQTLTTHSPMGTIGYLPMEFIHGNIISNKYDIFSLGVVMIKIIAGRGGYSRSVEMPRQEFIDLVLENWRNRMSKTCQVSRPLEAYCKQVNTCTEIALGCMDIDRQKRPKIADIVHRLNETEAMINEAMASWRECTPSLMNESLVKLEVLTKTEEIPYANRDDEYPILVRFTALPWRHDEEMSHPSVDLVVVINGSQSLKDRTKEAMITVINSLGSNDRLSIVSVSRDYIMELTYMTDKGRNFARHMVDRMVGEVVGGQVVSFGILELSLEKGDKLLRGRQVKEGDSRVGFILVLFILLRDDDTPKPETSSEFPVHVVDLDMDYLDDMDHCRGNHEVLRYIADQNYGTYSFIQSDIKDALELFMGGITNVAATSIDITLKAHEGVAISSIDSGGYSSHVNSEGRSGAIHINDIYAGETKNFIVNLKLAEGKGKLVTVGGQYRSQNASKQLLAETDVFILRPHIRFSRKLLDMHPEVAAELVRLKLVKGIWSRAHPTMYNLAVISQYIGFSEEGQCAPKQALVGLVKDLEGLLKQRAHSVYSGQAYILSWLSCHKWQRATTKGSCSSDAFMRKC